MFIREAKKKDIENILLMSLESEFIILNETYLNYYFDNSCYFIDLIFDCDNFSGFIIYSLIDGEVEIIDILIKKEFQNKSMGHLLVENIKKNKSVTKIILEVHEKNIKAIRFYEKNNFIFLYKRENYYTFPVEGDALVFLFNCSWKIYRNFLLKTVYKSSNKLYL